MSRKQGGFSVHEVMSAPGIQVVLYVERVYGCTGRPLYATNLCSPARLSECPLSFDQATESEPQTCYQGVVCGVLRAGLCNKGLAFGVHVGLRARGVLGIERVCVVDLAAVSPACRRSCSRS